MKLCVRRKSQKKKLLVQSLWVLGLSSTTPVISLSLWNFKIWFTCFCYKNRFIVNSKVWQKSAPDTLAIQKQKWYCPVGYHWAEGWFRYRSWGSLGQRVPVPAMKFPSACFLWQNLQNPIIRCLKMTLCSYLPYLLLERQTNVSHFKFTSRYQSQSRCCDSPANAFTLQAFRLVGEHPGSLAAAFLKDSFAPSFPPPPLSPVVTSQCHLACALSVWLRQWEVSGQLWWPEFQDISIGKALQMSSKYLFFFHHLPPWVFKL